ncbi:MAG TPA: 50S ribosomal protein L25/general stress protein Ctc [Alphaproteobacteria bacterium]|nr:50S ribosomal protein L25/general stress protein Ctc [Alphaproteobacteria bacterium]
MNMAEMQTIAALKRDGAGKGPARASRREGRVPGVIYGGEENPQMISIELAALTRVLKRGGFLSHQFMVDLGDGAPVRVIPRDLQLDPVRDFPLHVDFMRLFKGSTISVNIPVHIVGESASPGLKRGGVLNLVRHEIELLCPVDNIPDNIECDISALDIGDGVHISAIKLPPGVRPAIRGRDFTIATVAAPVVETVAPVAAAAVAAPAAAAGGKAAPAAAGGKAAPAAGGKAPAAKPAGKK